jgi:hypothetical protein
MKRRRAEKPRSLEQYLLCRSASASLRPLGAGRFEGIGLAPRFEKRYSDLAAAGTVLKQPSTFLCLSSVLFSSEIEYIMQKIGGVL